MMTVAKNNGSVHIRLPPADMLKLARMASYTEVPISVLVRQIVRAALSAGSPVLNLTVGELLEKVQRDGQE